MLLMFLSNSVQSLTVLTFCAQCMVLAALLCQKPYQQISLVITIQKSRPTAYRFVVIKEKVKGQVFGSTGVKHTGKNAQILLAMVSKRSSKQIQYN